MPAQALNRVEVPDYHLLLKDKIELPESLQFVQQLLAGHIQPDSDWAAKHPREAEKLFVELLSDAVMAESLGLPGLLPDPDSVLSALAQNSDRPRLQKLYQHYQLWRQGNYKWIKTESEVLEEMLQNQLLTFRYRERQALEALPLLDESSEYISKAISVEYSVLNLDAPAPPAMLDLWGRRFGQDRRFVGPLASILDDLQLAKQLPYPAMEIYLLIQLAAYFDSQNNSEQAEVVLQEAKLKASASGLKELELLTTISLAKRQPSPAESLLKLKETSLGQPQEIQNALEKEILLSLLKARQFKQAEPDLLRLSTSSNRQQAAWSLAVALHVGYPFARQRVLDAVLSDQPEENEWAVDALSLMPSNRDKSQARVAFKYRLLAALLGLISRVDSDLQSRIIFVLPGELAPDSLTPERLKSLLNAENQSVVNFALRLLLQSTNSDTSRALLPELTRLLAYPDIGTRYLAIMALPDLTFEDLVSRLKPVLDEPDLIAWPQAWARLAQTDLAEARVRLNVFCKQATQKEQVFSCLQAQYAADMPPEPSELVAAMRKWTFEPVTLAFLMLSGSDSKTWAALAQAAVSSEPEPQLQLLTVLDHATSELSQSSDVESSEDLSVRAALEPIASLMFQGELPSRLLALNLWSKRTAGLDVSVFKQALLSPEPAERAMAISLFALQLNHSNSSSPPLSSAQVLDWLGKPDKILLLPEDQSSPLASRIGVSTEPFSWHGYLANILMNDGGKPLYTPALTPSELYSLLRHPHAVARKAALELLANSGNPEHAEEMRALLKDPELEVRSTAYEALVQLDKRIYLFYLEALKENLLPAAELEAYLSFIASDKIYRIELYQDEYIQILENPVHRQTLWRLAESTMDQDEKMFLIELLNTEYLDK